MVVEVLVDPDYSNLLIGNGWADICHPWLHSRRSPRVKMSSSIVNFAQILKEKGGFRKCWFILVSSVKITLHYNNARANELELATLTLISLHEEENYVHFFHAQQEYCSSREVNNIATWKKSKIVLLIRILIRKFCEPNQNRIPYSNNENGMRNALFLFLRIQHCWEKHSRLNDSQN